MVLPDGSIETWILRWVNKMDMYMYFYCLEYSDYMLLKKIIVDYIEETLHERIKYMAHYINENDYVQGTRCSLFSMSIESEFTSKEFDMEFTKDVYQISTNVSMYINLFTGTIVNGICVLKEIVEKVKDLTHTNIIVLEHSSKMVYSYCGNNCYDDELFWNSKKE